MLGKTHRAGGCAAALIAFEVMRTNGWLLPNTNEYIQLYMMYPMTSWGSIFSDLDHGPDSIPSKDPVSILVNKLLRLSGSKHRSWQTHSWVVTGGFCLLLYALMLLGTYLYGSQDIIGWGFMRMTTVGFISGVISHLILDTMTTGGTHIQPGYKIRVVPRTSFFATGGVWENAVYKFLIGLCILIVIHIGLRELNVDIVEIVLGQIKKGGI